MSAAGCQLIAASYFLFPSMSSPTIGATPVAFSGPSIVARSPTMTIDR